MTFMSRFRRAGTPLPRLGLAALAFGLLVALPAAAKQSDRDQPMVIDNPGGSFSGFQKPNSVSIFKGPRVTITQGSLKLLGTLVKVHLDADEAISRVEVTGSPAHIEQLDDNGNRVIGEARVLDYDNTRGIAVLTGDALVRQQGRGEARGDRLTYDTQTSQMTGDSQGGGRVHMIFKPKPKAGGTAPATAASTPAPATSARQP